MTNRERLLRTNLYDLLIMINENLAEVEDVCVLDVFDYQTLNCIGKCDKCIENWLNQEEVYKNA